MLNLFSLKIMKIKNGKPSIILTYVFLFRSKDLFATAEMHDWEGEEIFELP